MKAATAADLARLLTDHPNRCAITELTASADGSLRVILEIHQQPRARDGVLTLVASDGIAPKDYVG